MVGQPRHADAGLSLLVNSRRVEITQPLRDLPGKRVQRRAQHSSQTPEKPVSMDASAAGKSDSQTFGVFSSQLSDRASRQKKSVLRKLPKHEANFQGERSGELQGVLLGQNLVTATGARSPTAKNAASNTLSLTPLKQISKMSNASNRDCHHPRELTAKQFQSIEVTGNQVERSFDSSSHQLNRSAR